MRIQVLITDAFGGRGGIAKFNRDLLTGLCEIPEVEKVTAWPRISVDPVGDLPEKLKYVTAALGGKLKYILLVMLNDLKNKKQDLLICGHINLLPLACCLKAIGACKKVVLIVHGIEAWQKPDQITPWLLKKIDHLISVSEFTRNKMLEWAPLGQTPYSLLPNCVDLKKFTPGPKDEKLLKRYGLQDKKVMLTVSRLDSRERYKGIDEMLEILPQLKKEIPNIAYLIVGDGDDRKRFEHKAEQLGIAADVVFAGYIAENEKADHYRLADVYVMPGRGEGFGIVYLEALACGVPVVAGKGDASEEVAAKTGSDRIVNASDPSEAAAAVVAFLMNAESVNGSDLSPFSDDEFREELCRIMEKIFGNSKTVPMNEGVSRHD